VVPADLVRITADTVSLIPGEEATPRHVLVEDVPLPTALLRQILLQGLSRIGLSLARLLLEGLVSLFRL
jgi:hypothetical protein